MNKENHLIAQFMGVVPKEIDGRWVYRDGVFFSTNCATKEEAERNISNYVKYVSSWDWIMPVYRKLLDKAYEEDDFNLMDSIDGGLLSLDIVFMYNRAIEILKEQHGQI